MLIISEQTIDTHENRTYRVAALIRELNSSLSARIGESLAHTGLTLPQLILVKALAHNGPMTISELARELCVSKPTVVGIVDRLEQRDLVARRRDENGDRREVNVEFATGSEERLRDIRSAVEEALGSAFSDVPTADLDTLESALLTAVGALSKRK
ncbi:MAG: hypothetical protein CVV51_12375 [Spirochaetae bacterium HGW-Spirochaetae-7]|jgi:DNA-binding MarR family transcriptional regulator|nr:MAG: hypothetical protein CVV51_12375 [Spirochaetae bacterium HGW-Spirochaetae-7]